MFYRWLSRVILKITLYVLVSTFINNLQIIGKISEKPFDMQIDFPTTSTFSIKPHPPTHSATAERDECTTIRNRNGTALRALNTKTNNEIKYNLPIVDECSSSTEIANIVVAVFIVLPRIYSPAKSPKLFPTSFYAGLRGADAGVRTAIIISR